MPTHEEMDNAIFQSSRSEFVEMVKFLIKEITQNISELEDTLFMQPDAEVERRSSRAPYRKFRRSFRELFLLTQQTVKNQDVALAVRAWFKQAYKTETKTEVFDDGIELAQLYLYEMYNLGLLDLNVSPPVDFPFRDVIEDITAEAERQALLAADISVDDGGLPITIDKEVDARESEFNIKYDDDLMEDDDNAR